MAANGSICDLGAMKATSPDRERMPNQVCCEPSWVSLRAWGSGAAQGKSLISVDVLNQLISGLKAERLFGA
jgi:hypothetical protein